VKNKDIGEIRLLDNEAIGLFINLYKLLFLGTSFASKMLKIKTSQDGKIVEPQISDEEEADLSVFSSSDQYSDGGFG